jgi:PKHD-type hydroxylase
MNSYWANWTGVIDELSCDRIKERGLRLKTQAGNMGIEQSVDLNFRSTQVAWFDYQKDDDITKLISIYASSANREFFGFDISHGIFEIQFSTYNANEKGKYDLHQDVMFKGNNKSDRKLTFVLQLSDPSEYDGGRFEFGGNVPLQLDPKDFLPKGSILVFPSLFQHRVTEVTRGTRHSLVGWIEGPKWR